MAECIDITNRGREAKEIVERMLRELGWESEEPKTEETPPQEKSPETPTPKEPKDIAPARPDHYVTWSEYVSLQSFLDDTWLYILKDLTTDGISLQYLMNRTKGGNHNIVSVLNEIVEEGYRYQDHVPKKELIEILKKIDLLRSLDFDKDGALLKVIAEKLALAIPKAAGKTNTYANMVGFRNLEPQGILMLLIQLSDMTGKPIDKARAVSVIKVRAIEVDPSDSNSRLDGDRDGQKLIEALSFFSQYINALEYKIFFERVLGNERRSVGSVRYLHDNMFELSGVHLHFWGDQDFINEGDIIQVFDDNGRARTAEVVRIDGNRLEIEIRGGDIKAPQIKYIRSLAFGERNGSDGAEIEVARDIYRILKVYLEYGTILDGYESLLLSIFILFDLSESSISFISEIIKNQNSAVTEGDSGGQEAITYYSKGIRGQESQEAVIRHALGRDNIVVIGPPGTGKTNMLVESVYQQTVGQTAQGLQGAKVLISASSNQALDKAAEGIIDINEDPQIEGTVPIVRVLPRVAGANGPSEKVLKGAMTFGGEEEDGTLSDGIIEGIRTTGGVVVASTPASIVTNGFYRRRVATLSDQDDPTNSGFNLIVIDEAGRLNVVQLLTLLALGKQVILAGDAAQLPPFERFREQAQIMGLRNAQLERLNSNLFKKLSNRAVHEGGFAHIFLDRSFRGHPVITEFWSRLFYEGKVRPRTWTKEDRKR
ncbi:AAA domain-containing protein, partial [Candidatus Omnitrophota bacterium]